MTKLIYPNLFLFLYDLREGLGEDSQSLNTNREIFAAKLPTSIRSFLFNHDSFFESEYLELLTNKFHDFTDKDTLFEGYYYPVRLNDTYGLLLGCSFKEENKINSIDSSFQKDQTHQLVDLIAQLKAKTKEKLTNKHPNIGQTWLIVTDIDNPNIKPQDVARKCCESLNLGLEWNRDLQGQGSFLGGNVFELSWYKLLMQESTHDATPPTIQQLQENIHLIIALMPSRDAAKQIGEDFSTELLHLFCYRHKILWAYGQSRYLKQQLKKKFTKIQEYTKQIKSNNFNQLRQTVRESQALIVDYSNELNNFAAQIRTIEINLNNYTRRLSTIQDKADEASLNNLLPSNLLSWLQSSQIILNIKDDRQSYLLKQLVQIQNKSNIKFWENFSNKVEIKYLLQLQKDYESLTPGLQLLTDSVNSIRTIIEITQTEQDRNFQYWAGIFGVGLATAALGVSAAIDKLDKNSKDPVRSWLNEIILPTKLLQAPQPWWFEPAIPLIYGGMFGGGVAVLLVLALWVKGFGKRSG